MSVCTLAPFAWPVATIPVFILGAARQVLKDDEPAIERGVIKVQDR
jgi:hypothetical protein